MAKLRLLPPRFLGHQFGARFHVGQYVGAVREVSAQVGQEQVGGDGKLRGVGAVDLKRVVQQQIALHQIAGVQPARQHQYHRQQTDPQDQAPKVKAEHGGIRQERAFPAGGTPDGGRLPVSASQAHMAWRATDCSVLRLAPSRAWIDMPCSTVV
ncbi:hypothetical protein D3C72_1050300 [compost metagenome]